MKTVSQPKGSPSTGLSLLWLLLIVLAIRTAAIVVAWGSLAEDPDAYGRLAVQWANSQTYGFGLADSGHVRPTAYRPPFYPWLISWLVSDGRMNLVALAGLHVWMGAATALLIHRLAIRFHLRPAFLPALAVTVDPLLLRGSQLTMTETCVTFITVALWWLWTELEPAAGQNSLSDRKDRIARWTTCVLFGTLSGCALLTRPTMLPWIGLLFAVWIAKAIMQPGRRDVRYGAAFGSVALLCVFLPWPIRNSLQLGQAILTTTHGGYTLLLANNPVLYKHFRTEGLGRKWDEDAFHAHWANRRADDPAAEEFWFSKVDIATHAPDIDEINDDRLANAAAKATIARSPSTFLISCIARIGWLWAPYPMEGGPLTRWLIGSWYVLWYSAAILGILQLGSQWLRWNWIAPALLLLTLTGIHAIYWSNMRMRAPLMPLVYVIAWIPLSKQLNSLWTTSDGTRKPTIDRDAID